MKTLLAMIFIAGSTFAQATEITVLDTAVRALRPMSSVNAIFYMDLDTNEGFVKVKVTEESYVPAPIFYDDGFYGGYYGRRGRYYPRGGFYRQSAPIRTIQTVFEDTVKIEGLSLVGDKVIFNAPEGEVECGTMGKSRILKVPTLYLSGACTLSGRIEGSRTNTRVVVKFKTK
jgi:hypothetical protein